MASPGGRVLDPKQAFFVVSLDSTVLTGGKSHSYLGPVRGVNVDGGQTLRFHYLRPKTTTLPVDVLDARDGRVRTAQVAAQR